MTVARLLAAGCAPQLGRAGIEEGIPFHLSSDVQHAHNTGDTANDSVVAASVKSQESRVGSVAVCGKVWVLRYPLGGSAN